MIDLYSDTQTRPSPEMLAAMANATVGDEQSDGDPTTIDLCRRVADLLGKEAGVLMPSGTMCNLVAVLVHTRPGDEVITARTSHLYCTEAAGSAVVGGVSFWPVESAHGIFIPADLDAAVRPGARTAPRSALLSVEQTTFSGGEVWRPDVLRGLADGHTRWGSEPTWMGRGSSMQSPRRECLPASMPWVGTAHGWT